jgi:hypothetical protein
MRRAVRHLVSRHKAQVEKDKRDAEDLVASKEAAEELEQQLAAEKAEALAQLESGAKAAGAEEETVQEAPDKQHAEMEGLRQGSPPQSGPAKEAGSIGQMVKGGIKA